MEKDLSVTLHVLVAIQNGQVPDFDPETAKLAFWHAPDHTRSRTILLRKAIPAFTDTKECLGVLEHNLTSNFPLRDEFIEHAMGLSADLDYLVRLYNLLHKGSKCEKSLRLKILQGLDEAQYTDKLFYALGRTSKDKATLLREELLHRCYRLGDNLECRHFYMNRLITREMFALTHEEEVEYSRMILASVDSVEALLQFCELRCFPRHDVCKDAKNLGKFVAEFASKVEAYQVSDAQMIIIVRRVVIPILKYNLTKSWLDRTNEVVVCCRIHELIEHDYNFHFERKEYNFLHLADECAHKGVDLSRDTGEVLLAVDKMLDRMYTRYEYALIRALDMAKTEEEVQAVLKAGEYTNRFHRMDGDATERVLYRRYARRFQTVDACLQEVRRGKLSGSALLEQAIHLCKTMEDWRQVAQSMETVMARRSSCDRDPYRLVPKFMAKGEQLAQTEDELHEVFPWAHHSSPTAKRILVRLAKMTPR